MSSLPGPLALLVVLGAASVLPSTTATAEGGPCFVGLPLQTLALARHEPGGVELRWNPVPTAESYEVLRCDASEGPCDLRSYAVVDEPSYVDQQAAGPTLLWYEAVAVSANEPEECDFNEYCSLPMGQCVGDGICGPYDEFCNPDYEQPVCGCNGNTYTNPCLAGAAGINLRHPEACLP